MSIPESANTYRFSQALQRAQKKVKTILENQRNPRLPKDVAHTYDDKFALAEMCVKTAIAAQLNELQVLGLTMKHHEQIRKWIEKKLSVTLRFENEEFCKFDRETTRDVESKRKYVVETTSALSGNTTETHKVVTTVTDYFWTFDCKWSVRLYAGPDPSSADAITLRTRSYKREIKTASKSTLRPPKRIDSPLEVNLTWLFTKYDTKQKGYAFRIDRTDAKKCRTPRRNPDVENAMRHFVRVNQWSGRVASAIERNKREFHPKLPLPRVDGTFPVVAAVFSFEENKSSDDGRATSSGLLVSDADYAAFMKEHERALKEVIAEQEKVLSAPSDAEAAYSASEGTLMCALRELSYLSDCMCDAVGTIENMLRSQVIAAIGKEVQPKDFAEYMDYHYSRLFRPEYRPRPFCYAIRLPGQFPQGTLSIEASGNTSSPQPIRTAVMKAPANPMKFALNAATDVHFGGDRFVHAAVFHQFSNSRTTGLNLVARARQFSSFVLMVGKISDAKTFAPTSAMIVKDKDDLRIPLMLETIPTPKEFRDAIESLSPEQQRFCKAFRSMQLASTLFAVCVIEIKPQLEKVLNLPPGALTKEIALTQGLSELFIKYQIPPDLLSYDGDAGATLAAKLQSVKSHHDAIQNVIEEEKKKEIEEERKRVEKQRAAELALARAREERTRYKKKSRAPRRAMVESMAMPVMCSSAMPKPCPPTSGIVMAKGGGGNASAPPPAPATTGSSSKTPSQTKRPDTQTNDVASTKTSDGPAIDYTALPAALDAQYEALDEDSALRPTIIKVGKAWTLKSQDGLLSDPKTSIMGAEPQKTSKNAAFDLLDALTRSGAISVDCASLHIVLAATHCFDLTLMDSIVKGNVNPIEKVERSQLIMCTTIQGKPASALIDDAHVGRIGKYSPMLIEDASDGDDGASKS